MTQLTENIYAIDVPNDAHDFEIDAYDNALYYRAGPHALHFAQLTGQWSFICTSNSLTEEQAKGIVGDMCFREQPYQPFYRPYGMSEDEYEQELRSAENDLQMWQEENQPLYIFHSLLKSKGLDGNYAILKKVTK